MPCLVPAHGLDSRPRHGPLACRARHGHGASVPGPCSGRVFSGRARSSPAGLGLGFRVYLDDAGGGEASAVTPSSSGSADLEREEEEVTDLEWREAERGRRSHWKLTAYLVLRSSGVCEAPARASAAAGGRNAAVGETPVIRRRLEAWFSPPFPFAIAYERRTENQRGRDSERTEEERRDRERTKRFASRGGRVK